MARVSKLLMYDRRTHVEFPSRDSKTFDEKLLWDRENRLSLAHQGALWKDLRFQTRDGLWNDPEVGEVSLVPEIAEELFDLCSEG